MSESNGYLSPFIGDGYDATATIPESAGQWSAVQIRYRPLSADEESEIFALQRTMPQEAVTKLYAAKFAGTKDRPGNLRNWDLKDRAGKPVPITPENIGRLSPGFFVVLKTVLDGSLVLPSGETEAEADAKN